MMQYIITVSLITLFLHACTWEGMIFAVVRRELAGLPGFLRKPLYDCPTCMTIWWGILILCTFTDVELKLYPLILFAAGGLNVVLSTFLDPKKKCNCDRRARLNLKDSD